MQVIEIVGCVICVALLVKISYLLHKVNKELNDIYEEMR